MAEPSSNEPETVSLKEHLEKYIDKVEQSLCDKINSATEHNRIEHAMNQVAITKAEASVNERLISMNEFRGQLKDQTATFISHPLYDQQMNAIAEKIKSFESAVGLQIEILAKSTDSRIKELELERAKLDGKASQNSMIIALVSSLLGIALSIIALITKIGGG